MIRDLKVSYINDCDTKVTLAPAREGIDLIDHCCLATIFAKVVRDSLINEKELLEVLAYNLHCQIEIKEKNK